MFETIRSRAFEALRAREGGRLARAALRANQALGRPLASRDELAERRAWDQGIAARAAAPAAAERAEPAPVTIFHLDRHHREVRKIGDLLAGAGIAYTLRNIDGDEPATEAAIRDAGADGLPLIMVGGTAVGGFDRLNDLAGSGELARLVWGQP